MSKKPSFVVPEWADWMLALIVAGGIWLWMNTATPVTTIMTVTLVSLALRVIVAVIVYLLVWVLIRSLAEPSRLYGQGLKILHVQTE